ncbi:hypothetical protein V1524DRAFT_369192 [Lipomyces starkeyi]
MKTTVYLVLTCCTVAITYAYDITYYSVIGCQEHADDPGQYIGGGCFGVNPDQCCPAPDGTLSASFNCNPLDEYYAYEVDGCNWLFALLPGGVGTGCISSGVVGLSGAKYSTSPFKLRERDPNSPEAGPVTPAVRERRKITKATDFNAYSME